MTKSTSSAMNAEAAIAESINQLRDEILYYARLHLALESPLDIQTLANWARLYIVDQEEQTLTTLNLNGSLETREFECTPGVTYNLPAVPDAVISHIQVISSRLSEIRREAFLCLSMAHFRLWQADEDLTRSNFLHALQSFQSAVFNLSEGMSALGISHTRRQAAFAKRDGDPKQAEKSFIHECWENWKKNPAKYKSKAAFAKDMLNKCENLESQKVIEDWCREWEKTVTLQAD